MRISVALLLLSLGLAGMGCSKAKDALSGVTTTSPTEGVLTFSAITATSVTVSWPAATGSATADADLQYQLVYSLTSIASLTDAQAATIALPFTAATLTKNVTGLTASQTYYFAVLVKDTAGNVGYATASSGTLCSGKVMFVVLNAGKGGALGGSSGADTICNNNKPTGLSSSTFKALLSDDNRRACYTSGNDSCSPSATTGRLNWPIAASTTYCTSTYTGTIGTSSSAAYLSPTAGILATVATNFFTGMNIYWGESTSNNCGNWANTGAPSPVTGNAAAGGGFITAGGSLDCNTVSNIVCIEQ